MLSELPAYKPPRLRQLKVTAFFRRESTGQDVRVKVDAPGTSNHPPKFQSSADQKPGIVDKTDESDRLNSSLGVQEITIIDSDDDEPQEIFCSDQLLEKRRKLEVQKRKRNYDPWDFVEFETFNYNDETLIDKNSLKERRRCPFYKRIPYSKICVDAFNFAKEDGLKYYILSHFHADHYVGITKGFDRPIYCSPITARLVRHKFRVKPKYIQARELNEPFYIDNIRVTFYDANHCPGAVIILFELPNFMRYLHTGDFRACPEMEKIYDLSCAPIDCCFLDTTFCDVTKTFPSQDEVLSNAVSVCKYALERTPRTLIVCGSYCIGKEKVFLAVAEALNLKVWASKAKREYFSCIQDPRLDAVLVDNQNEAKIHVLPLKSLWKRGMREYLEKHYEHFDAIVALRPSGWEYKRNKHMVPEVEGNIAIYPVPYSEHSSYNDLERFIRWLRPRRIIPTVNMGDPIKRGQMNNIFRRWQRSPRLGADLAKAVLDNKEDQT
jgi:DNA cross-link repair 1A protein